MCLKLFIHNRFGYCILVTLVCLKEVLHQTVIRNQEYVGFHETEAALSEIHFYHIRKHLLPESMFNIEQLKFFLSSLLLLPVSQYITGAFPEFPFLLCFSASPASQGPFSTPSVSGTFLSVLVWEQGPRWKPWADTILSLVLCPILGKILSLIPHFATDLLGQPWTKTCH